MRYAAIALVSLRRTVQSPLARTTAEPTEAPQRHSKAGEERRHWSEARHSPAAAMFPLRQPVEYTAIDDTSKFPVHPQWSTYQANMALTSHLHPDWGDWSTGPYGIPWQSVGSVRKRRWR